jgi:branched-chain amino acid transport system permease protein
MGFNGTGRDKVLLQLGAALVILAAAGFLMPSWAVFLLTLSLARGLVVLGLLILWRTGLVPFGQALFYGAGAYAVGLLMLLTPIRDIAALTLLSALVAALLAGIVGQLLCRYRDIFFAMLAMAFSMILYGILVKTEALGSTDGFNVTAPTFMGYAPTGERMRVFVYLWVVFVSVAAAYGVHRYLSSAMGQLATAIRDNEIRVEYLGVSVERVILIKVIIAASLAGAGGAITAFAVGHIDPDAMAYWTVSGEFVFVTILSGSGSVLAPFIGSLLFELIRTYATQYAPHFWQMVLGVSLLLIILFLPNGLWSVFTRLAKRG